MREFIRIHRFVFTAKAVDRSAGSGYTPVPQMRPANVGAVALRLAFIFASAGISCADALPEARTAVDVPLPPYTARAAELFDDRIEPNAVGYPVHDVSDDPGDRALQERVQSADSVVRARVVTVTSEERDSGRRWQIALRNLENLAGSRPLAADFTIQVSAQDPAAGIVRAFEDASSA